MGGTNRCSWQRSSPVILIVCYCHWRAPFNNSGVINLCSEGRFFGYLRWRTVAKTLVLHILRSARANFTYFSRRITYLIAESYNKWHLRRGTARIRQGTDHIRKGMARIRRGTAPTLPNQLIVLFYVLFVCKCVLYYCHRMATQLQLRNTRSSSSSCSWRVRRVSCSLILKMQLVPPSLPRSSYVPSSFWFIL